MIEAYPGHAFTPQTAGMLPWLESDPAKVWEKLTSADAVSGIALFESSVGPATTVNWRQNWYDQSVQPRLPQFGSAKGIENPFLLGRMDRQLFRAWCLLNGIAGHFNYFSRPELAAFVCPEKFNKLDPTTQAFLNVCPGFTLINTYSYNPLDWLDDLLTTPVTDGTIIETLLAAAWRRHSSAGGDLVPSGGAAK